MSWWLGVEASELDAFRVVKKLGTNGLPYLIHTVAYEPPPWKGHVPNLAYRLHLISGRADGAADSALRGFRILGQTAEPAVPKLGRILRSTKSCTCAVHVSKALINIGDAGINELIAAIQDPDTRKKPCIIYYGMTEPQPPGWDIPRRWDMRRVVPALLRSMGDPESGPFARVRLVEATSEDWITLVPVLAACLRHPNESMRIAAAIVVKLNPNVTASIKIEADGVLNEAPPELVKRLAAN